MRPGGRPQRPSYALGAVGIAATIWLLVQARPVLEPLTISVLLWFLLTAAARAVERGFGGSGEDPPLWAHLAVAAIALVAIAGLSVLVSNSLASFRENLPAYEENVKSLLAQVGEAIGLTGPLDISPLLGRIEVSDVAIRVAGSAVGFVGVLVIVVVYVIFIFTEAAATPAKFAALAPDPERRHALAEAAGRIRQDIEIYLGVKCIVGLAQAVPTWIVLALFGVDGAAFWAVVIFLASFVPTIGSLIGIIFPSLVALGQFGSVPVFLGLTALLAAIQLAGSNWLEPKLMGSTLNLSPLVILIAIFAGGAIWGITGALIAVPALSIAVIVFSRIDSMRPIAVLLSSDGKV